MELIKLSDSPRFRFFPYEKLLLDKIKTTFVSLGKKLEIFV